MPEPAWPRSIPSYLADEALAARGCWVPTALQRHEKLLDLVCAEPPLTTGGPVRL